MEILLQAREIPPDLAEFFEPVEVASTKDVFVINPQPFPGAHFAVWPASLCEPMILAGSSEKGCCAACGAPWERVVDYEANYEAREQAHVPGNTMSKVDSTGWKQPKRETIGWKLTCSCNVDPVPCTVLDPFAGAGTTLMTALAKGRNAIGIELNEEYARMAAKRIRDHNPLFNRVEVVQHERSAA